MRLSKIVRRWLWALGLATFIGFVALNWLAYRHAYAMMHFSAGDERTKRPEQLSFGQKIHVLFSGVNLPRPQSNLPPSDLAPGCTALTVKCTNGISLSAWFCPAAERAPLVVLFHGYGGQKTGLIAEAKAFLQIGMSVLLVDFRGSGGSSESYTTIGYEEAEDVAAAVGYARTHLAHNRIILYGQSMGAAAIFRAIANCGVQADAVIAEAGFDEMLTTVRHRFEAMHLPSFPAAQLLVFWGGRQPGFNGFAHNPVSYAASVRCPALFLHGTADPRARVSEARHVFAAVRGEKNFVEFPGLGHEAAIARFPVEWNHAIEPFVKSACIDRQ